MSTKYSDIVSTARDYYNSNDADAFYFHIWGGEDIHIGLYEHPDEDIYEASRRTVQRMRERLNGVGPETKVLDLGGGYAGSCRLLCNDCGCEAVSLNLSEEQNERGRRKNRTLGLDNLIDVVDGNFEDVPYPDNSFDVVWSQDAFLHSGERFKVLQEAVRVLKDGGELIFTDPMQADDCPEGVLDPILERIHLDTLGSPAFYRDAANKLGLEEVCFEDHSHQLPNHYFRVLKETESREGELSRTVSPEYIQRMKKGLQHWVEGGKNGHLTWGIFHFRKS
jgi:sarcosine/dimethylglycine N-methyltransferase